MPIILILTQKIENESVKMLIEALQQNQNIKEKYKVLAWEINNCQSVHIEGKRLVRWKKEPSIEVSNILLSELSLVIKRTWGPIRKEALKVCQHLEAKNIQILNGCHFIEWSHSKINQYECLKDSGIIPKTTAFREALSRFSDGQKENEIISTAKSLGYPLVFKTSEGCRVDGVYLIESELGLKEFIKAKKNAPETENGFVLQEFLQTNPDKYLSHYYRINIIDGRAQSAAQFQLYWKNVSNPFYKELVDFPCAKDKPATLELFDAKTLQIILDATPLEVVGIDVVLSNGQMRLLEYNDGPNISLSVNLGKKYQQLSGTKLDKEAAIQCAEFANQIANFCSSKLLTMSSIIPLSALSLSARIPLLSKL